MDTLPDTSQYIFDGTWAVFHVGLKDILSNGFIDDVVLFSLALILLNLVLATLRRQGKPR